MYSVKKKGGDPLTVEVSGRIDSGNAPEVEAEIQKAVSGYTGSVVLDAAELEYISSAGLRVILRLKKSNPDTSVINCTSEVYEIFDMAGLT